MRERPILFSGQMVRAILEGRKTQTRRVVNPQPYLNREWNLEWSTRDGKESTLCWIATRGDEVVWDFGPGCGAPGDKLSVREAWGVGSRPDPWGGYEGIEYRADVEYLQDDGDLLYCHKVETPEDVYLCDYKSGWKPSIYMPRWASRIDLEITEVRVQRLQEITEEDARAEGVEPMGEPGVAPGFAGMKFLPHASAFVNLWDSINGKTHPWASDPWVWAVSFKVVKGGPHAD